MRFLLIIFFAISSPAFAQESNPLVGTWKLISSESIIENEVPQHLFGLQPKGYLIITQEGRLMIMITADNRRPGMGDAERAALHKTMAAASGKVRVEGKDFIIIIVSTFLGTSPGTAPNRGATSGSKAISLISAKKRSTRLSQDEEVGMKCILGAASAPLLARCAARSNG